MRTILALIVAAIAPAVCATVALPCPVARADEAALAEYCQKHPQGDLCQDIPENWQRLDFETVIDTNSIKPTKSGGATAFIAKIEPLSVEFDCHGSYRYGAWKSKWFRTGRNPERASFIDMAEAMACAKR